jgi:hypothetical protein
VSVVRRCCICCGGARCAFSEVRGAGSVFSCARTGSVFSCARTRTGCCFFGCVGVEHLPPPSPPCHASCPSLLLCARTRKAGCCGGGGGMLCEGQRRDSRLSAYVSLRQHTSAYVRIRQHTSAYVSILQHTSAYVRIRQHTSAYACCAKCEGVTRVFCVSACTFFL